MRDGNKSAVRVEGLTKTFSTSGFLKKKSEVRAVKGVSFEVESGGTLGLIGESGSGKSTTARMICRLVEPDSGTIEVNGQDILKANRNQRKQLSRVVQIVFQDPGSSLNPRWKIDSLLTEGMAVHNIGTRRERIAKAYELLELVGLPREAMDRFPHEFSGGQRQRIAIARALAVDPSILILDEPVSALDVSVQAQIIRLLKKLQKELRLTYLMVSHDLAVVEQFCDTVCVMRNGEIVEAGTSASLLLNPKHEYTRALVDAHPDPDPSNREKVPS